MHSYSKAYSNRAGLAGLVTRFERSSITLLALLLTQSMPRYSTVAILSLFFELSEIRESNTRSGIREQSNTRSQRVLR